MFFFWGGGVKFIKKIKPPARFCLRKKNLVVFVELKKREEKVVFVDGGDYTSAIS